MGRLGFEPRTSRLKAECSTTELATPIFSLFIKAIDAVFEAVLLPFTVIKCSTWTEPKRVKLFKKYSFKEYYLALLVAP